MKRLLPLATLISATALLAVGCEPTCASTCKKLHNNCADVIDMGDATRDDCEDYCKAQEQLYEELWSDEDLADGFGEMKSCIKSEECEDIAEGVCYDEDFYLW